MENIIFNGHQEPESRERRRSLSLTFKTERISSPTEYSTVDIPPLYYREGEKSEYLLNGVVSSQGHYRTFSWIRASVRTLDAIIEVKMVGRILNDKNNAIKESPRELRHLEVQDP